MNYSVIPHGLGVEHNGESIGRIVKIIVSIGAVPTAIVQLAPGAAPKLLDEIFTAEAL